MSNEYYPTHDYPLDEDDVYFGQIVSTQPEHSQSTRTPYADQSDPEGQSQQPYCNEPFGFYQRPQQLPYAYNVAAGEHDPWITSMEQPAAPQETVPFPQYDPTALPTLAGPSNAPSEYLSPEEASRIRSSRATSFASNASSVQSYETSNVSRSVSPNANEMLKWGQPHENGRWSCAYPGCTSQSTYSRGCDLRKHYKRHTKSFFCRHEGCPQATEGGFSSKKDRARHEAKHNPDIVCEWEGCDRLFSRVDNMKDHVRRVHKKRLSTQ